MKVWTVQNVATAGSIKDKIEDGKLNLLYSFNIHLS